MKIMNLAAAAILSLVTAPPAAAGLRVLTSTLTLEEDGAAISGAKVVSDVASDPDMAGVTFCARFNFRRLGPYQGRSQIVNVADWIDAPGDPPMNLLFFSAMYPFSVFGFGNPMAEGSYKTFFLKDPETGNFEIWDANRWAHVCVSFDKATTVLRVVKDGSPLNVNYANPELANVTFPPDFLNKTYLARCSFDFKATCSGPEGQLADFNVWDRALSLEEAQDWTSCRSMEKGNLLDWDRATLDLVNMTAREEDPAELCRPVRPGHVIFPLRRNFSESVALCRKMRGLTSVMKDRGTQDALRGVLREHRACGDPDEDYDGGFWAGYWDEPDEGNYTDVNTGAPILPGDFEAWFRPHAEPNGDRVENCAIVWSGRNSWNDLPCGSRMCTFCELEASPVFQIRGLCDNTLFDHRFSWTRHPLVNGRHSFSGYSDSLLAYDPPPLDRWRLRLYSNESVYAVANGTELPLGTGRWDVHGEPCYGGAAVSVDLSLTACNGSEFNCGDGNCVDVEARCDGETDCPDKSDEVDCAVLTMDRSYLRFVQPPAAAGRGRANVSLSVDLLSILDIVEVDNLVSLQFGMSLTWADARLAMHDLSGDRDVNTLTPEFVEAIWTPRVVFHNTNDKEESVVDGKASVTIDRRGGHVPNPLSEIQASRTYQGSENPITVHRVYSMEFLCEFNMADYPFDTQVCSLVVTMKGNSGRFVELDPGHLAYLGPIDLTQYFVKEVTMSRYSIPSTGRAAIKVDVVFSRRILATVLTTYLPTGLLCLVCFATNFFKAFFFEAVVTVNLTSMLVLTTLFISVSNSLPTTAYIKMIDVWLLFNLLVPFCEVLLHTYIDSLREDVDRSINQHGRVVQVSPAPDGDKSNNDPKGDSGVPKPRNSVVRKASLVARDEHLELAARREFYATGVHVTNEGRLRAATLVATIGLPSVFAVFVVAYFTIGMAIA